MADREKLRTLMAFAQAGDTIRVKSIDRLARDTRDLLRIVDELAAKGVAVEFLDSPMLNVTTKEGRAMLTVFAAFAELEREAIRERQAEGLDLLQLWQQDLGFQCDPVEGEGWGRGHHVSRTTINRAHQHGTNLSRDTGGSTELHESASGAA